MAVPLHTEVDEVVEGLPSVPGMCAFRGDPPAQAVGHLDVEECRCCETSGHLPKPLVDRMRAFGADQ